jgi:hypothetical protein
MRAAAFVLLNLIATCDQAFLRFDDPFSGAADLRAHDFAACMLPASP